MIIFCSLSLFYVNYIMPDIGVIGGSGIYSIPGLRKTDEKRVETPFGEPSGSYLIAELDGRGVVFLPRHGSGHAVAPHKINYRANIWGMRHLGVKRIIAVNATGSLLESVPPRSIVIPHQLIDYTAGARAATFFEDREVVHVDFTDPYCPELRSTLADACRQASPGAPFFDSGVYVCVNGPRLETAAEIAAYAKLGGSVIGMTGMPEAVLARESEMCYCALAVITNYAAGINPSARLTTGEVLENMRQSVPLLQDILRRAIPLVPAERSNCLCAAALKDSRL
ncbi:MAG: S-methyl-5'-thioadenosine phosphorylase [Nitrospiraceae bacterium]|nr:S-methyl-5'-thioadenosine phosphorylase [Nitrospiraceae bacterium]